MTACGRVALAGFLAASSALLALATPTDAETIRLPRTMPSFSQNYTSGPDAWGNCRLGSNGCPDRMWETGCLVTAFACVLSYFDISVSVSAASACTGTARTGMDPGILNDWLRLHDGYGQCTQDPVGHCCLDWGQLPAGIELEFHSNRSDVGLNAVAAVVIDHALRVGNPVIAGVHWAGSCNGSTTQSEDCHWIVLTGKVGQTYSIIDPYNPDSTDREGLRTTLDRGSRGAYVIDRFVVISPAAGSGENGSSADEGSWPSTELAGGSPLVVFAVLGMVAVIVLVVTSLARR